MQIPLNDDSEYSGGRLVYITSKGFLVPRRLAGSATIHTTGIVHGVSTLYSGVRYGLFMCDTIGDGSVTRPLQSYPDMTYVMDSAQIQIHFYRKAVDYLSTISDEELSTGQVQYVQYLQCTRTSICGDGDVISNTETFPNFMCELLNHVHKLHPRLYLSTCQKPVTMDSLVVDTVGVDLFQACKKQLRFMTQVLADLEERESNVQDVLSKAFFSYIEFLSSLRTEDADRSVPSVLVDHIWHTHMGFPSRYSRDCFQICGFEVDHVVD